MYLAYRKEKNGLLYDIRQSYLTEKNSFDSRVIFILGPDPRNHFEIYDDHIVIFSPALLQAVKQHTSSNPEQLLEHLLLPFLPAKTRENIQIFSRTIPGSLPKFGPLTADEKIQIRKQIHIFDRRRLYYLRYGAVDQSRLSKLNEKCCRLLLGQSRDEREYYFRAEEQTLEPGMYLQYVFAIFNLQRFFSQSFASWLPEALAFEEMADKLEETICSLNRDTTFWKKKPPFFSLHPHLRRYLIMFFDYRATPRSFLDDFSRSFRESHRNFKWPEKTYQQPETISKLFGVKYSELEQYSKKQLNKAYRQKAMELHPDRGGDHEKFVALSNAYQTLLKKVS